MAFPLRRPPSRTQAMHTLARAWYNMRFRCAVLQLGRTQAMHIHLARAW